MLQGINIMDMLQNVESTILLGINHAHCTFCDEVMWLISDRWGWIPLYMFLVCLVYYRLRATKCLIVVLLIAILIFITDQTCAHIIRPWIGRLRPSRIENPISEFVRVYNEYRGNRYGFPSCHAANTFALAVFLSLCMKNKIFTLSIIFGSMLLSYSRLYLEFIIPEILLEDGWSEVFLP